MARVARQAPACLHDAVGLSDRYRIGDDTMNGASMYRLSEEQQRIVREVAAVADQSIAPHAARVDSERAFPGDSLDALAKAGFLGLTVPPAFGGSGQGLRTMAAALDEVGQRCASTAMVYLMHLCGVACYAAASDKTASYLRAVARGDHLST